MINIIYENKDFIAINKPAGILVHPVNFSDSRVPAITDELLKLRPEIRDVGDSYFKDGVVGFRPGIVHRLDKDTSGVMVIAKNQDFFVYMKELFQRRKVKKTYIALVYGKLSAKKGIINKPISLKSSTVKRTVYKGKMQKEAVTEYKLLKLYKFNGEYFSLLKVMPKTGRTHQIRLHLASIGYPIVGDSFYGRKNNPFGLVRQFLHAESLEFSSKDGERFKLAAGLPEELKHVILQLHGG